MHSGDTVKAQIHQLQARNAELQAFKDSVCRGRLFDTSFSSPPNPINPTSCVCKGDICSGADLARQSSSEHGEAARSQRTNSYTNNPGFDDEITNVRPSPGNAESSHTIHAEVQLWGPENLGTAHLPLRSGSADYTLQPTSSSAKLADETEIQSSDLDGFSILPLDPDFCFSSLAPSRNPGLAQTSPTQTFTSGGSSSSSHSEASPRDGSQGALRLAVANGHVPMARLLIKHGADVNARDGKGRTVLLHAVKTKDAEMVELLLENQADVKNVDDSGMSALDIAASLGHVDVAEVLLRHGRMAQQLW